MKDITIASIGDSTLDTFLEIAQEDASLLCDIRHKDCEVAFKYGEKIPVREMRFSFGGSALNAATGFATLGLSTSIYTILGDDNYGKAGKDYLNSQRVNTKSVILDGRTNQSTIVIYQKERTIFSYHFPRDYSKITLENADWIYFCSATQGSDKLIAVVSEYIKRGSKLVFNPGSWQLKNFEHFVPLVALSEIFILNRSEADNVIGEQGDISKQLDKMQKLGTKIAVITDGANGAYAISSGKKIHMSTLATTVVDPTGAGDAFSVGFVIGIIQELSIEDSLKWGMVNSGHIIENIGANENLLNLDKLKFEADRATSAKASIIK